MEQTAEKYPLQVTETVFDDFEERPVDLDFVLPDYCPDIAAVLKCILRPTITSRQWSGDRLLVDGSANIRLLYLDEDRCCVRCYEMTQPYTASFHISAENDGSALIGVSAQPSYLNCRATGPRRVDIHGAFRVYLNVQTAGTREVLCGLPQPHVFCKTQTVTGTVPAAAAEKPFSVSETLELPEGVSLVYADAVPVTGDCKALMNKLIVKGSLLVRAVCIGDGETGELTTLEQEIPFSQIVDVEGLNESWQCLVSMDSVMTDIHQSGVEDEDGGLLAVNCKLNAAVHCLRTDETRVLLDAYAVDYPLELETAPLRVRRVEKILHEKVTVRETVDLPDGVAEVADMWGDAQITGNRLDGDHTVMDGRLMVTMLARDGDGMLGCYERTVDFSLPFDGQFDDQPVKVRVLRLHHTPAANGKIELTAEMEISRVCCREQTVQAVTAVTADEKNGYAPETAALKVIFCEAGEDLWQIAKSCRTSMEEILAENGLQGTALTEPAMLMIPMV